MFSLNVFSIRNLIVLKIIQTLLNLTKTIFVLFIYSTLFSEYFVLEIKNPYTNLLPLLKSYLVPSILIKCIFVAFDMYVYKWTWTNKYIPFSSENRVLARCLLLFTFIRNRPLKMWGTPKKTRITKCKVLVNGWTRTKYPPPPPPPLTILAL